MTVDAPTEALLRLVAAAGRPPLHELTLTEARASSLSAASGEHLTMYSIEEFDLPTTGGAAFRVRVLKPTEDPRAIIVYYHGGGWVMGDIEGFDLLGRTLAQQTGATVVLVNYRKAPEAPFPAPVEDASAALEWVDQRRGDLAAPGAPLVLAGDSAGANLAIVATLRSRGRRPVPIELMLLVYPVTDSDFDRPSYVDPGNQHILSRDAMRWFFDHYAGDHDRTHPDISPVRAEDLSEFPPSVILLAEHDPLVDEGAAFADRLDEVGSLLEKRVFAGQIHGFFTLIQQLPAAREAIDVLVSHVNRLTAATGGALQ